MNADEWNEAADLLDQIAERLSDPKRVKRAGELAAEIIRGHIYDGAGMPPISAATQAYRGGGKPLQDTGALRDSITLEMTGAGVASVGTTKIYAPIQNNGGTIKAKKGWLFIPAEGTRALQRRYGYKPGDLIAGLKSGGYSVYRVGRTVCYRKRGKGSGSRPGRLLYYLKRSVVIPARRFFYLSDEEVDMVMQEVSNDII